MAWIIPLTLAVYVAIDAGRLGARRGRLGGGLLDQGPIAWFFAIAILGLIGVYLYTRARPRLVEAKSQSGRHAPSYPQAPVPVLSHAQARPHEKIIYPPQA